MPKTLTWGRSIDVVELSSTTSRALGKPRVWEVRTKAGGHMLGIVAWQGDKRAYTFAPDATLLGASTLLDIGKFCQNQTEAMMQEKRRAAG